MLNIDLPLVFILSLTKREIVKSVIGDARL